MKLAIVGSGNMAKAIGSRAAQNGVEVLFATRDVSDANAAAAAVGHGAKAGSLADALGFDLILLATPFGAASDVVASLGGAQGKTLIDISNPLAADYMSLTIGHTTSAGEELAKLAPKARVVKAFNSVFASVLQSGDAQIGGQGVQVFVAGDDSSAKGEVSALVKVMGFEAVDVGALSNSRYLEPLTELLIQMAYGRGLGTGIAFKLLK